MSTFDLLLKLVRWHRTSSSMIPHKLGPEASPYLRQMVAADTATPVSRLCNPQPSDDVTTLIATIARHGADSY
jgi:hypothetical protein